MTIPESQIEYIPADLKGPIITSLTGVQLARIKEYCNMTNVTGVEVRASYIGGHAEIYIKNNLGQGAATALSADSELSKKLEFRSLGWG